MTHSPSCCHQLTNPVGIARNGHPCDPASRWRRFAFSKKEGENGVLSPQRFEATRQNLTSTYITIKLNGKLGSEYWHACDVYTLTHLNYLMMPLVAAASSFLKVMSALWLNR